MNYFRKCCNVPFYWFLDDVPFYWFLDDVPFYWFLDVLI